MIVGVTGGAGFIGRRLVARHVERGDAVRVLTRRHSGVSGENVQLFRADLAASVAPDLEAFVDGLDVLYHCAGVITDVGQMRAVHVKGTDALITAARGRVGRWVQLSSVGAYGPHREGPVTEEATDAPIGEYESTKSLSDRLVLSAVEAGLLDAIIVRPSNVFGPAMINNSLRQLVSMIERGLFFFIGKPGALANYIHVESVVDALVLAGLAPRPRYRLYNVSQRATLDDFVRWIAEALGVRTPALRLPEPLVRGAARLGSFFPEFPLTSARIDALTVRSWYPTDRIEVDLGFRPTVSLRDGIMDSAREWQR